MSDDASLWRSVLFVPAHIQKFVDAAHTRKADAVQLDLEDSVPADAKGAARQALGPAVAHLNAQGTSVLVRINRDLRNLVLDLEAAILQGVRAVSVPKADSCGQLQLIDELMTELESERGLTGGAIGLIAMVETLAGLEEVQALARATPRLTGLTLGSEDFSADGGFEPTSENLFYPSQRVLFAAKAAGLRAYGFPGSIAEFGDLSSYRAQVQRGRSMGFDGAFCIHPRQVEVLNETFRPTDAAIEHARQVIRVYEAALAEQRGAAMLDGRMIDLPVVQRAHAILAQAH